MLFLAIKFQECVELTHNFLTEFQRMKKYEFGLNIIEQEIDINNYNIEDIAAQLPGYVHLNRLDNFNLIYADRKIEALLGISHAEMASMGEDFFKIYVHPQCYETTIPRLIEFGKSNDHNKVIGHCEKIRKNRGSEYKNYLGFTRILKQYQCFLTISYPLTDCEFFLDTFDFLEDENDFLKNNYKRFSKLTRREIEILTLIGEGKKRRFIAEQLNISLNTFDNHRKHIREKLNVSSSADLFRYIQAFKLHK